MIIVVLFMATIGLVIGSFCGATVWRIHAQMMGEMNHANESMRRRMSISKGRSMCMKCHHALAVRDLIPLISWLSLRGKCRYCHAPIGNMEPLIEASTALLFVLSYLALRPSGVVPTVHFILWLYILSSLVVLTAYDFKWLILPNVVIFPAIAVAMINVALSYVTSGYALSAIKGPVFAAILVGGTFLALASLMGGRLMGFGDVKLALLMGLALGLKGVTVAMVIAFDVAAVIGILLIVTKVRKRTDHIPFGPFLALGTVVAFLFSPQIIHWYLTSLGAR